ncbi:hypothetical protein [Amycolatopsis jejuensis]|uniref:hypothetical protein n=1 Tax=Amycolatopsis jejuensis TaxID=330084 RepID=UPI0005274C1C|nr:hypothetical protein [Amycolatopsis jejuensis]
MARTRLGLAVLAAVVLLGAACAAGYRLWGDDEPEAVALPGSCPALPGLPPARSSAPTPFTAPSATGATVHGSLCEWGRQDHGFPPLQAKYQLYGKGRTQEAHESAAAQVTRQQGGGSSLGADTPLPGLGDEARISAHDILVILVTRKANVVLTLQYRAPDDEPRTLSETTVEQSAQTLLDLVQTA